MRQLNMNFYWDQSILEHPLSIEQEEIWISVFEKE